MVILLFREIISNRIKVIERTQYLCRKIKREINSANNVSGVTSFNLCKMAGHALHCTKFREIISNGIKVIERTRFLY